MVVRSSLSGILLELQALNLWETAAPKYSNTNCQIVLCSTYLSGCNAPWLVFDGFTRRMLLLTCLKHKSKVCASSSEVDKSASVS